MGRRGIPMDGCRRQAGRGHDHLERVGCVRKEGCNVLDKNDESEYGKFGWVIDPEGNKVELWEPPPGQ
jgi:predicted enzyme related to lactoylglutathione lyase